MGRESIKKAEIQKHRKEGNATALEDIVNSTESRTIKKYAAEVLAGLKIKKEKIITSESTEGEMEKVETVGGKEEDLNKLTEGVDTEIENNINESTKVISEAESRIEELLKENENLKQRLEEVKTEFNGVMQESQNNDLEEKRMLSLIKIAEGFLDFNHPKSAVIKMLEVAGASQVEISKIMTVLNQDIEEQQEAIEPVPVLTTEPTVVIDPEATPANISMQEVTDEKLRNLLDEEVRVRGLSSDINTYEKFVNNGPDYPELKDRLNEIINNFKKEEEPTPVVTPEPTPTSAPRITSMDQQTRGINESGVFMMPENRSMFEKMSEGGRSILNKLYKGINPAPGVSRLIAKVGIGYNEFWINTKEESSSKLKDKMDGLDLEIKTFDQSKAKMQGVAETLRKNSNPGFAALEIEIKKINKQEAKIANKRDKIQSKIEKKENRARVFTNKRDAIADKMISKYEQKLSVIEGKLEVVTDERDRMELFIMGREVELDEDTKYFDDLEKSKNDVMRSLMSIGQSAEKAERNSAVKNLEKQIEIGRKKIEKIWEELQDKLIEIDEKVAKIDAEAEPYRDRRDEFVRVKDGRPIDFDLPLRNRLPNERVVEETSTHMRPEANHPAPSSPTPTVDTTSPASAINKIPNIGERVTLLNEFIKKNNLTNNLQIDQTYLLNNTRLTREKEIDLAMFKKIIAGYYKVKKIPEVNYKTLLNNLR